MDILLNIDLRVLNFCIDNDNIHLEGSLSQIFDLGLSFYFMSKNFSFNFYLRFHKIKTET